MLILVFIRDAKLTDIARLPTFNSTTLPAGNPMPKPCPVGLLLLPPLKDCLRFSAFAMRRFGEKLSERQPIRLPFFGLHLYVLPLFPSFLRACFFREKASLFQAPVFPR